MILDEDDDRRVLARIFKPVARLASRGPSTRHQLHRRTTTRAVAVVRVPAREGERGQRQGRVVAVKLPADRTQMLPAPPRLVPAHLDRDDRPTTHDPDERGSGSLKRARGLVPDQPVHNRGTRWRLGLVEKNETGRVDDDNVGLTGTHQRRGSHGFS